MSMWANLMSMSSTFQPPNFCSLLCRIHIDFTVSFFFFFLISPSAFLFSGNWYRASETALFVDFRVINASEPLNSSTSDRYRMIANEAKSAAEFPEFYAPTRESGEAATVSPRPDPGVRTPSSDRSRREV
jgi:hypothetical protein